MPISPTINAPIRKELIRIQVLRSSLSTYFTLEEDPFYDHRRESELGGATLMRKWRVTSDEKWEERGEEKSRK
jgi:hypothetical protein